MPHRLSVCLITRDEASCLANCLTSVKELASEIIVCDTGSVDQTVQIAAQYGARVIHQLWQDDFAAARNVALEQATGDWILVLDADEQLLPDSREILQDFLEAQPEPARINLKIINLDDQNSIQSVFYGQRLFANLPQLRFTRRFHEYLVDLGTEPVPICNRPDLQILHRGYRQDVSIAKNKAGRNRHLLNHLQQSQPDEPVWLYYSANQHDTAGNLDKALAEYLAFLDWGLRLGRLNTDPYYPRALIESLGCFRRLNQVQTGLAVALQHQALAEQIPDYWYVRGTLHRMARDESQAFDCFERCLGFDERLLTVQHNPFCLKAGPLMQMLHMQRIWLHRPDANTIQQQSAWQAALVTAEQGLNHCPEHQAHWLRHLLEFQLWALLQGLDPVPLSHPLAIHLPRICGLLPAVLQGQLSLVDLEHSSDKDLALYGAFVLSKDSRWLLQLAQHTAERHGPDAAKQLLIEARLLSPWDQGLINGLHTYSA